MATGKVKWFNLKKGYGFIQPDDGGGEVMVIVDPIEKANLGPLDTGQKVRFELKRRESGKMAAQQLSKAE